MEISVFLDFEGFEFDEKRHISKFLRFGVEQNWKTHNILNFHEYVGLKHKKKDTLHPKFKEVWN